MAHIICCACHRHVEIKPLRKGKRLRCSNCGSQAVRVVRRVKHWMLNGGMTEGRYAKPMTYAALLSIRQARGYREGWAGMKYRAIFGCWPEPEIARNAVPRTPSGELLWWIKRESKAYAKMRREQEAKPIVVAQSELMSADDWSARLPRTWNSVRTYERLVEKGLAVEDADPNPLLRCFSLAQTEDAKLAF